MKTNGVLSLIGKYNELVVVAKGLRALVEEIQWDNFGLCVFCDHHKSEGHGPDCDVRLRLEAFKAVLEK